MIWKTLIEQLKNQLDPVDDIIHNAGTGGWELHTLYLTNANPSSVPLMVQWRV
jgi:hypothetical protein